MTLIEKLKDVYPEIDVEQTIKKRCPRSYFKNAPDCYDDEDSTDNCDECWGCTYLASAHTIKGFVDGIAKPNPSATEAAKKMAQAAAKATSLTILDSGDRTEFETGAVRDMREGKGRCDLMPLDIVGGFYEHLCETKRTEHIDGVLHSAARVFVCMSYFQNTGEVFYLYDALQFSKTYDEWETMFLEVAKHFEEGCKKYGEDNWRKGIPVKCYIDSATRHYLKFLRGDKDEPHDRAFVWNILCCIWTVKHKDSM